MYLLVIMPVNMLECSMRVILRRDDSEQGTEYGIELSFYISRPDEHLSIDISCL